MTRFCIGPGCGNTLTGKQRKWCSDACRKKAMRAKQKGVRVKKDKRPGLSRYSSDFVGYTVHFSLKIKARAVQVVPALGNYHADAQLRSRVMCEQYAVLVENAMNEAVFGYKVTVDVVLF